MPRCGSLAHAVHVCSNGSGSGSRSGSRSARHGAAHHAHTQTRPLARQGLPGGTRGTYNFCGTSAWKQWRHSQVLRGGKQWRRRQRGETPAARARPGGRCWPQAGHLPRLGQAGALESHTARCQGAAAGARRCVPDPTVHGVKRGWQHDESFAAMRGCNQGGALPPAMQLQAQIMRSQLVKVVLLVSSSACVGRSSACVGRGSTRDSRAADKCWFRYSARLPGQPRSGIQPTMRCVHTRRVRMGRATRQLRGTSRWGWCE